MNKPGTKPFFSGKFKLITLALILVLSIAIAVKFDYLKACYYFAKEEHFSKGDNVFLGPFTYNAGNTAMETFRLLRPLTSMDIDSMDIDNEAKSKLRSTLSNDLETRFDEMKGQLILLSDINTLHTPPIGTYAKATYAPLLTGGKNMPVFLHGIIPNKDVVLHVDINYNIPKGYTLANDLVYVIPSLVSRTKP